MSERSRQGMSDHSAGDDAFRHAGQYVPPKSHEEIVALRDRIVARFDKATGSSSASSYGPLLQAILEELFPVSDSGSTGTEGV